MQSKYLNLALNPRCPLRLLYCSSELVSLRAEGCDISIEIMWDWGDLANMYLFLAGEPILNNWLFIFCLSAEVSRDNNLNLETSTAPFCLFLKFI